MGEEHIDDVTVIVNLGNLSSIECVDECKRQILEKFKSDKKLEKRCQNVRQVFINHNMVDNFKKDPWEAKCLGYDNGCLFYPGVDDVAYERHFKLNSIGI